MTEQVLAGPSLAESHRREQDVYYLACRNSPGFCKLYEIDTWQRLGGGMLRQPGTGIVFVAAEGRRVFVLDVEPHDADGNREPMRCVQVLATDHPDQSLKTAPVLTGPAGATPAPRFLVLAQAQGTLETRIRAFALPPPSKDRNPGDPPPEVAIPEKYRTARTSGIEVEVTGEGENRFDFRLEGE